jgi:cell wall-associated NlpC family hydrolase
MTEHDPRLTPTRPDLAAAHLEDQVEAQRFAKGRRHQVTRGVADLRRNPDGRAPLDSQLLYGEIVQVYEAAGDWAWLQNETDGFVGYAPAETLSEEVHGPSHVVSVPRSFLFPEPDLKAPPLDWLSMAGAVSVTREHNGFSELAGGGWLYSRHLAPLEETAPDYVATALEFLGVPYLWGGKSSLGLDCSALIQIALNRAGLPCPRDSDQQETSLGEARPVDAEPERGDLIYFPGHVAIALDDWRVVNANAHDMMVTIEPLADLLGRVEREFGSGITAIRRPIL